MPKHTMEQLTLFQEDFPVNRSRLPGSNEANRTNAIYGRRCAESYERLGHNGLLVKTLLDCCTWRMAPFLKQYVLIWKMKAIPSSRRLLFQLVPRVRGIAGTGSGLLLTPATVQVRATKNRVRKQTAYRKASGRKYAPGSLLEQLTMIPTILASECKGVSRKRYRKSRDYKNSTTGFMRSGESDPINLHPSFAEAMMGFPIGWTESEH